MPPPKDPIKEEIWKRKIIKALKGKIKIGIPKDRLKYLYLERKLNSREIAKKFSCTKAVILERLH